MTKIYRTTLSEVKKLIKERKVSKGDLKEAMSGLLLDDNLIESIWTEGLPEIEEYEDQAFREVYLKYVSAAINNIINEYMDRVMMKNRGQ
jgi:hypothetical protein